MPEYSRTRPLAEMFRTGPSSIGTVKISPRAVKIARLPAGEISTLSIRSATERQRVVRRYLVQDKGATAKRVGECRPTLEIDDQGTPRVEVSLKR